jgi:hypothetical protein
MAGVYGREIDRAGCLGRMGGWIVPAATLRRRRRSVDGLHGSQRGATRASGWAALLALALSIAPLAGCTYVVALPTPYYEDGPQQADPPQGFLKTGDRVLVFGTHDSYARIFTPDGTAAFVWRGHLVTEKEWREREEEELESGTAPSSDGSFWWPE